MYSITRFVDFNNLLYYDKLNDFFQFRVRIRYASTYVFEIEKRAHY